jgi:hypothetical protein
MPTVERQTAPVPGQCQTLNRRHDKTKIAVRRCLRRQEWILRHTSVAGILLNGRIRGCALRSARCSSRRTRTLSLVFPNEGPHTGEIATSSIKG